MNMMTQQRIELSLWKEIAGLGMSVSHDRWHIDQVLRFAYKLHELVGGDFEILTAAAILHDLGRADRTRAHGQASRQASIEMAERILEIIGFPQEKRHAVLTAIEEHDQSELVPSSIEGKILKDADFLSGFGAWGVLRIALWSGESGRNISTLLQRVTEKMPERLNHVEFLESYRYGRSEMLFSDLFIAELEREPEIMARRYKGVYIVLEGISGSGKGTQARRLQKRLVDEGYSAEVVHEPTDDYRAFRNAWMERHGQLVDSSVTKHLLMADRSRLVDTLVRPGLESGRVIVSDRSYISTLVYQCSDDYEVAATAFDHRFVPIPDVLILLDVDPNIAWSRIENREKPRGVHETLELLPVHRERYFNVCKRLFYKQLLVIDASQSPDSLSDTIWSNLIARVALDADH